MIALKEKLIPQDAKIIELKYTGKTFGAMSEDERWFGTKTLLLKIHAITGWSIPVNELMDILIDQLQMKLQEGYVNVTIAEIEYAFRHRDIDTKDWGKALSLTLIDEVMNPYLATRYELSKSEESARISNLPQIEVNKGLTDEEMAEWLMDWKGMLEVNIDLIPLLFYEFLDTKKIIDIANHQKWAYTAKAVTYVKAKLQDELGLCKTNDAYLAYNKFKNQETVGFDKEFAGRIKNRAKRLIVYDYLKDKL